MWRIHYTSPENHRLTLRGRKRKTLLRTIDRLAASRSRLRVYQQAGDGSWYRSSTSRLLSF